MSAWFRKQPSAVVEQLRANLAAAELKAANQDETIQRLRNEKADLLIEKAQLEIAAARHEYGRSAAVVQLRRVR